MTVEATKEEPKQQAYHSFRREFKDAYKIDITILQQIEKQIAQFASKPLSYSLSLDGDYTTRGDSYDEVMGTPLIDTRKIKSISISSGYRDPFHFDFKAGGRLLQNNVEVWGYDDPLKYEGLLQQIEAKMRSLRPWYWPLFRWHFQVPVVIAILVASSFAAKEMVPFREP